ncbi:hypothetical protein H1230_06740 [Paenibacillus sp. 19GGS1-52]|uniref:hypothetical protein n=1 Tax=Paenibacillus sp. 19GGS1-52 TaxID=2758563 RepID=UPI001EFAF1AD|nr:hypothetical protein [Paenibacillus sp. 19GGS1-52]ULO08498.1 hypothetical protein H1230_06740 [Paenibacillus sp. 19GGS1-52]
MGNTISMPNEQRHLVESISMSNGLTSVFLDLLVISGSLIAQTNRERELIIWLAQRDQPVVGIGTVGFDIDEIPWSLENFEMERNFMSRTIISAINGLGWERLNYEPRRDWVIERFEQFQQMINTFDSNHINEIHYREWSKIDEDDDEPKILIGYPKCNIHFVYLSCHGCILCNNGN